MIFVTKRNGSLEELNIDKINKCVERACHGLEDVSASEIVLDAHVQFFEGVTTKQIDQALILSARAKIEKEPNYAKVAARLLLNVLYKEVFGKSVRQDAFEEEYREAFINNIKELVKVGQLDSRMLSYNLKAVAVLLRPERDLLFKYLGIQTLYDRYFLHIDGRRMETPQAFFMRIAMGLALQESDDKYLGEFYNAMSSFDLMPSTPTLFNSGTSIPQLSSCYVSTINDSIDGIFDGIWQEARKSKYAGGLSVDWSYVRGTGAHIKSTNGISSGIIPWIKVFNDTVLACNQAGKRKGAAAAYLEIWHYDIEDFIQLRKTTGDERRRANDIHLGLWIPDLFMERVRDNGDWYLFCPSQAGYLHDLTGSKFKEAYIDLETAAKHDDIYLYKKVKAKDLWKKILMQYLETGEPYLGFKDAHNIRYTDKHIGVVHNSNLCTETSIHNSYSLYKDGYKIKSSLTAVCNLNSINIVNHITPNYRIDISKLKKSIAIAMRMLDNVINLNFYPTEEAKNFNLNHRAVGLGLMGFQDWLHKCNVVYDSKEGIELAEWLQEIISYYAIRESINLAKERGKYPAFDGSEWSKGKIPIDTYNDLMTYRQNNITENDCSSNLNELREDLYKYGIRNNNVMAIAPTATISYIVGCSPSIEPDYSVLYVYSTLSGSFTMINEYFVQDAKRLGIWSPELIAAIKETDGDIQNLKVPQELKDKYKTAFQRDQKQLIAASAARQKWIDQSISLNLYYKGNSLKELSDLYFFGWEKGIKCFYYLRTKAASKIEKVSISATPKSRGKEEERKEVEEKPPEAVSCDLEAMRRGEVCESCQ